MGGMNEVVAPPPTGATSQKNGIRIHENKGEIHFHDDTAGFKVAVDKPDVLDAYKRAESDGWKNPVELISKDKSSVVSLRQQVVRNPDGTIKETDLEIVVRKITLGGNFGALKTALGL